VVVSIARVTVIIGREGWRSMMGIKILIILTLLFGIDEMERREPGYGKPGDGQGGGIENNPNVPVDDWVYVLVGVIVIYGVIKLNKKIYERPKI
jgi:hypothetical protein